jgi:hypothetical protein
MLGQVQYK